MRGRARATGARCASRRAFAPEIERFSKRAPGLAEKFRSLRDAAIRHAERKGQQRNSTESDSSFAASSRLRVEDLRPFWRLLGERDLADDAQQRWPLQAGGPADSGKSLTVGR